MVASTHLNTFKCLQAYLYCRCCSAVQDLKQEIKHTLQNKLHRNAGPEDLVAAEAMLQRIYGEGSSRASC